MEETNRIKEILENNAYKIVETFPEKGEVNLRLGINMKCPIVESQEVDREDIHLLLKSLGYKIMIRQKDDGICQFIIRK